MLIRRWQTLHSHGESVPCTVSLRRRHGIEFLGSVLIRYRMMDQLASIGVEFDETTIDRLFTENKHYFEHPVCFLSFLFLHLLPLTNLFAEERTGALNLSHHVLSSYHTVGPTQSVCCPQTCASLGSR